MYTWWYTVAETGALSGRMAVLSSKLAVRREWMRALLLLFAGEYEGKRSVNRMEHRPAVLAAK